MKNRIIYEADTKDDHAGRRSALIEISGSVCLFLVLPFIAFVSTRSATFMVALSMLLVIAAVLHSGRFAEFKIALPGAVRSPLGKVFVLALTLGVASTAWSPDPGRGLVTVLKITGGLAVISTACAAFRLVVPSRRLILLTIGVSAGSALCLIQLHGGLSIRSLLNMQDHGSAINRAVMTQALLVWPAAAFLVDRGRFVAAVLVVVFVTVTALTSESGASTLVMTIGIAAALVAYAWRRLVIATSAGAVGVITLSAPWLARLAYERLPGWFHDLLDESHSWERVVIWNDFTHAISGKIWFGWGMGGSRVLHLPAPSDPSRTISDIWMHPHNALLQVWVEFGVVGAVISVVGLFLGIRCLASLPRPVFPFAIAAFSGAYSAAAISHGAWQSWWLALIGATVIAFGILVTDMRARSASPS